jgi:transposase-like protein
MSVIKKDLWVMTMYNIESEAAVQWGQYVRDVMCEWFKTQRDAVSIGGVNHVVEIDESLFGRKMKYHRGARLGQQVWVFAMVDRTDGRTIIWPVANRSAETLLPIINKFVLPGTIIYSDGWAGYLQLEAMGYSNWVGTLGKNILRLPSVGVMRAE